VTGGLKIGGRSCDEDKGSGASNKGLAKCG